jgi:Ca-activated chloride channel family protein
VRIERFPAQRLLFLVAAGLAIGLAAAGPLWLTPEPPEPPPPLDVTIAVDLSLSMTARDAVPSRIGRAQEAIARITEEVPSVRFSVVVFAGWPYTLVSPTDDPAVVRYFAESLQPDVVPERARGNSLSAAIELARSTLEARPTPEGRQAILILSDGDVYQDEADVTRAATEASGAGVQIWVAGLGGETGVPVTMEGETVRDVTGATVATSQDVDLLRAVADAGDGRYEDITEEEGLQSLIAALEDLSGHADEAPPEPFDTTGLLALLAIPLLLWEGAVDLGRSGAKRSRPARDGRNAESGAPGGTR